MNSPEIVNEFIRNHPELEINRIEVEPEDMVIYLKGSDEPFGIGEFVGKTYMLLMSLWIKLGLPTEEY